MFDWCCEYLLDLLSVFDFENVCGIVFYDCLLFCVMLEFLILKVYMQFDYLIFDFLVLRDFICGVNGDIFGFYSGYCSKVYSGYCFSDFYVYSIFFGEQIEEQVLFYEDGFKGVCGYFIEGCYLVFELNGYVFINCGVDK